MDGINSCTEAYKWHFQRNWPMLNPFWPIMFETTYFRFTHRAPIRCTRFLRIVDIFLKLTQTLRCAPLPRSTAGPQHWRITRASAPTMSRIKKKRNTEKVRGASVFVHPSSRRSIGRVNRFAVDDTRTRRRCRPIADQSSPGGGRSLLDSTGKQTITPMMIHRAITIGTGGGGAKRG